jgi:hypothetical protein
LRRICGYDIFVGGVVKTYIKGRALDIALDGDEHTVVEQLLGRGLQGRHVEVLAGVAIKFAEQETESLERQLVPPASWPGIVVCRRHSTSEGNAWLLLKREKRGWKLDSALFD